MTNTVEMLANEESMAACLGIAKPQHHDYIKQIFKAVEDKVIANARYNDAKYAVNSVLETVYDMARADLSGEERWNLSLDSYPHVFVKNMQKVAKTIEKRNGDATAVLNLLKTFGPLAVAAQYAKSVAVKKAPALSEEERKAQYIAEASTGATKALHDRLVTEVAPYRERLTASYDAEYGRRLKDAEAFLNELSGMDNAYDRRQASRKLLENAHPLTAEIFAVIEYDASKKSVTAHRKQFVQRSVDEIIFYFIYKTCHKLKGVMEIKGDFETLEISTNNDYDLGVVNNMVFTYADGSQFSTETSVVHVINQFNTRFVRNPMNIRSATYADGSKLKAPCLENLTEKWAKNEKQ